MCVVRLEPNNGHNYYRRADIYRDLGENEKAIADYITALEYEPESNLAKNAKIRLEKLQQITS